MYCYFIIIIISIIKLLKANDYNTPTIKEVDEEQAPPPPPPEPEMDGFFFYLFINLLKYK
jgi:hypothetical protein